MFSNLRTTWAYALTASLAFNSALAQVTTDCNPMEKDCPAKPAFGIDYTFNFNATPAEDTWASSAGQVTYDKEMGAVFSIDKQGVSPTLTTKFYFFFGRTEMLLKVAPGTGIISSMMWLSDVLDEVDWEFFGSNTTHAESNYFGKGEQDFHNAIYFPVGSNVQDDYHNYTTVWTKEKLEWYIDGNLVRTLLPDEAKGGKNYPQTPMKLSLGIWAGGDPSMPEGTREWAGGDTDFGKAPFTMYVKSIRVEDFTKDAKEYSYGDRSGSWESIKVTSGNSTVRESIFKEPEPTISEKWEKLPDTSKTAVYASAGGVGAIIVIAGLWYCIRQRRRGASEAKKAEQRAVQDRMEVERFEKAGVDPDSFADQGNAYRVAEVTEDGKVQEKPVNVFASPFDSRPNTTETNEKQWPMTPNTPGGAAAMRSPVPLLQDGASSPRVGSPGPWSSRPYSPSHQSPYGVHAGQAEPMRSQSPAHALSPMGGGAVGMGPGPGPRYPPNSPSRSASGPNAYMRTQTQSPGMQQGYGGPRPSQSPTQMLPPRSASAAPRANQAFGHPGGPDGYWNNAGAYR